MNKLVVSLILFASLQFVYSQSGWIVVNPGFSQSYKSVHFIDANTGIACGNNGAIIRSTDGGLSWFNLNSNTTANLNDVKMLNSSVAIVIGYGQLILRTTNGGANWNTVYSGNPNHTMYNLCVFNSLEAKAYSKRINWDTDTANMLTTTNSGSNWSVRQIAPYFSTAHFINIYTGWYCGSSPGNYRICKTSDNGLNWNLLVSNPIPPTISFGTTCIYFYSSYTGFKCDYYMSTFSLKLTADGGFNWSTVSGNMNYGINSISFNDSADGWAVGNSSIIYSTLYGGYVWNLQTPPISNTNLWKVFFINNLTGWIAADYSGIWKTTNGGISSLVPIAGNVPDKFSLYQNYPNPFNPSTKIRFDIPSLVRRGVGVVVLNVYDLLGHEVATLVNEPLKPSTYEVEFDGASYASGIYFYKLIANEFVESKKMILIK